MKKLSIAFFITVIFLTGCINKEEDKASSPSISSSQPALATSSPTPTETEKTGQPIATFFSESQDKQLLFYENMNSTSPLTAQITDKSGSTNNRSNIPTQKDWEKGFRKDNIFASIHSDSNINWILLTSDPAAGLMGKTLYKTSDNGKSWVIVNDVSLILDGYVTGVSFRDDKNGWIGATQHGAALVPLYRTKDGGQTWSLQELSIPKGYKYGNVYPPIFDEKDIKQGTLKIEFVSDTDKTTMEFITTDGGETWKSYTNTGEIDSANVNLTDNEVKDILNGLIPKAVAIYGIFNGTGWFKIDATKTIPGENEYCLVTGETWKTDIDTNNVKSIADLKKVVEDVFTKDIAEKVFYSRYLTPDKGRPLYKDYEGKLYEDTKHGGHGWARKFLFDTAKIKSQKDNVVEITLDTTSYDDPDGTLIITIEYANGKWLMASGLDDYESRITGAVIGYVTKIENQRALIVSPISRIMNETIKEYYDAYWVSNMPSNLEVGQYVHVWFENDKATYKAAIYPGQGRAVKIAISESQKPQKAKLSQDEVIRKALMNKDIANINILVIKDVTYDEKASIWTIDSRVQVLRIAQ